MRLLITTVATLLSLTASAQLYTDWIHFQDHRMMINPAYTGIDKKTELKGLSTQLFSDITYLGFTEYIHNQQYFFSGEFPIQNSKSSLGISCLYWAHYSRMHVPGGTGTIEEENLYYDLDNVSSSLFYSYQIAQLTIRFFTWSNLI